MRVPGLALQTARPQLAAALILTAMALMGLVDNYVVVIADTTGLWQFQVIRSAMAMAMLAGIARAAGWRLRPVSWARVAARSAVLSAGLMIYFAALAVLPIAQAVAGLFTAPMFIVLISMFIYGERVGAARLAAVAAGFAGVLMVLRPDAGSIGVLTVLPVLAGFLYALAQLATRRWCAAESAPTLLAGFFVAMGLWGIGGLAWLALFPQPVPDGAAGWAMRLWGDMAPVAWAWTVAQAVFSMVAVGFIIRAYQLGEASTNAVFEYALLVFAVLWGWLLLGNGIDGLAAAGIALILGSGAVIALRSPEPPAPVPEG
ncbi:DMT family transporter [Meridianimarinicoccus sp. RP-17]|uniref:DMT family transporter n=1 Tax=Meridianimarinicoccus zhengii TaxID=2056810 RepID=UPI001F310161|nr:DMT family transporter [Phycocomes zhengii]